MNFVNPFLHLVLLATLWAPACTIQDPHADDTKELDKNAGNDRSKNEAIDRAATADGGTATHDAGTESESDAESDDPTTSSDGGVDSRIDETDSGTPEESPDAATPVDDDAGPTDDESADPTDGEADPTDGESEMGGRTTYGNEVVEQRVGNETVVWSDDLEGSLGDWGVEGGVWAKGVPEFEDGPRALSGEQVFGTNLTGNTSINQDARLVSPEFLINGDENPRFRFAYWHSLGSQSKGVVQISVDGGDWKDLDAPMVGDSRGWGQRVVPLRDYDGKRLRIGVRLVTGSSTLNGYNNRAGIYVDDASFATGEMEFNSPDDLENGLGNWSVEGGVWGKGVPEFDDGPRALSGEQVFGTNLTGNTSINQDARLVSPEFLINGDENPRFRFAYWHSLGSQSKGVVQISVDGGDWKDLDAPMVGDSRGWGQRVVPLRDYDGKRLRIGVRLVTGSSTLNGYNNRAGIYVDDASFATGEMEFNSPDDLENGLGNWSVEGGVWGKGVPEFADGPRPLSGEQVFGTNLLGNTNVNQDARLVSPEFLIDGDENPRFRFAYWHSLGSQSMGVIQISVDGGSWTDLDAPMLGDSGGWGQRVVPLRDYDGKRVRIGVRLITGSSTLNGYNNKPGIYVDDASFAVD